MLTEDSYGRNKRLNFALQAVRESGAKTVLDVGCGTGAGLTCALGEAAPGAQIVGVDSDRRSIEQAAANSHPANIAFVLEAALAPDRRFRLVLATEVLEHVDDPIGFLMGLVARTEAGGRIVLTVPNGYGPFEACSLFEVLLNLSGLQRILRGIKRTFIPVNREMVEDTLAVSPHVNFFTLGEVLRLFAAAGLNVKQFRPNTFLCGYGLDTLIRSGAAVAWNARIADRLPTWCASDWMFVLAPESAPQPIVWRRSVWADFRRKLNLRRWNLC